MPWTDDDDEEWDEEGSYDEHDRDDDEDNAAAFAESEQKDSGFKDIRESSNSVWVSWKAILFFLLLLPAGLVLASVGSGLTSFQDASFGFGILFWVIGIFGAVYCIVRRVAGPKAAALAVAFLFVILLSGVFSGSHHSRDHDRLEELKSLR